MDPTKAPSVTRPNDVAASNATSAAGAVALVLLIVGGLNWALVGLFEFDLVAAIFGPLSLLSRVVYIVVGLAAIWALTLFPRIARGA